MSNKRILIFLKEFLKEAKQLRKKYRNIDADIRELSEQLESGETVGERIQGTSEHIVYKARLASRDMQRGKSGAFRVIYYLQTETKIYMLTIYAKTERVDISSAEILELIDDVLSSGEDAEDDD